MFKKLLLAAVISLSASSAFAACTSPLVVKDASGNSINMSVTTGADGYCQYKMDIDTSSQFHSDITSAIPAGTNIIGQFGIDQTVPGTTNAVSASGASSNAGSAVASSSTNVPTVSYLYAWNGSSYDQLQVDGSKQLKVGIYGAGSVAFGANPSVGGATPTFAFLAMPATTTTQIVALSGSTVTYVTSLRIIAGGTVNVTLKYGTGSNCGTGTTTLEGPYPLTAQAGFSAGAGTGAVLIVPAGKALCVTTDASVGGGVAVTYQQI